MGARINYVFRDTEDEASVVLYSHWGETEWQRDLAMALQHAKPRWAGANALLTMSDSDAEMCAMNLDWTYRLGQRDDEIFAGTFDYRTDRVTVTVMKGFVTQVNVG